ncbi:hypothetical protein EDC04DRAFT_2869490 [Pisolithus marmoratus]|nr:hypothetical protein EDC04DRAFT_2869490 [Pisolithus marmoratus]
MSTQEEQLIELMLTLKNTNPDQARSILASTPQIAYALITLMVKMNACRRASAPSQSRPLCFTHTDPPTQKTVTAYSASVPTTQPAIQPVSAVPPHLAQHYNRTPTPQTHTPTHYNGHGHPPQPQPQPQSSAFTGQIQYGYGAPPPQQPSILPDALASLPEEQKVMIMRVVSMTPEQISMLPPTERAGVIQLRTTLGLPS